MGTINVYPYGDCNLVDTDQLPEFAAHYGLFQNFNVYGAYDEDGELQYYAAG